MKRNMLRWFGHIERMESDEFVKKLYVRESVGPNSRVRPPGRCSDGVEEYMCERCCQRGRPRENKEGVLGQGEVETFLPWPLPEGTFPEMARQ